MSVKKIISVLILIKDLQILFKDPMSSNTIFAQKILKGLLNQLKQLKLKTRQFLPRSAN